MPIESHPELKPPGDAATLWRYMGFTKYLSLLDRNQLYFPNLEALANSDPHEGLLAQPNYRHREWKSIDDLSPTERDELRLEPMAESDRQIQFWSTKNSREYWLRRRFYDRRTLFVNCWHVNNYESAAMWSGYGSITEGIAIVSDPERIVRSLTKSAERLFAGMVEYLDFEKSKVDNHLMFPLSKRISFAYENEFRLIHWDLNIQERLNALCSPLAQSMFHGPGKPKRTDEIDWGVIEDDVAGVKYPNGRYVDVELGALIEEVRVSPASGDWFLELVRSVSKRYGLAANVTRSDLLSSPVR
jgi:hypothetical protein